jgi:hypothetical protein
MSSLGTASHAVQNFMDVQFCPKHSACDDIRPQRFGMSRNRDPFDPPPDPAPEYTEWIQHRYDPGYWLGGRIPPYLKRKQTKHSRGNPHGYMLLLAGATAVASASLFLKDVPDRLVFVQTMLITALIGLSVFAGLRLIRGPNRHDGQQTESSRSRQRRRK